MDAILKNHIKRKKFCHGYLFHGDKEKSFDLIYKTARHIFCENLSHCGECYFCKIHELKQNPDFYFYDFPKFGVEESASLIQQALKKSFINGKKIFSVNIRQISREAQNALLKILEEPPLNTYFLIYSSSYYGIIETVRSRLTVIESGRERIEGNVPEEFFKMNLLQKIDLFVALKDRKEAKDFLLNLIPRAPKENIKKLEQGINLIDENLPLNLVGLNVF